MVNYICKITKNKNYKKYFLSFIIMFFTLFSFGCTSSENNVKNNGNNKVSGSLKIHFVNVGQGDGIVLKQGEHAMIVDAGPNDASQKMINYIKSQGIRNIDYVVGTHPHEDHIGGLDCVINTFNVNKVFMPKITSNTRTYRDVIKAIKNKNLKITLPKVGESFNLGEAKITILGPVKEYEDANNNSIVLKVEYGNNSIILTGDAESLAEKDIINKGANLKADVLKLGHHGSSTSTSNNFLHQINPKYAVVSLGKHNKYKHPHKETMDKMRQKDIKLYRTDESGDIVLTSDGNKITFNCKAGSYTANGFSSSSTSKSNKNKIKENGPIKNKKSSKINDDKSSKNHKIVYWTTKGKSYHFNKNCSTLIKSKHINSGSLNNCPKLDSCDKCCNN